MRPKSTHEAAPSPSLIPRLFQEQKWPGNFYQFKQLYGYSARMHDVTIVIMYM